MKKFVIFWLNGTKSHVEGLDEGDALRRNVIGNCALAAVDFIGPAANADLYEWDSDTHRWRLNTEIHQIMEKPKVKKDYQPFDLVIYKPTGQRGLVKSTNSTGAFVLFRIQSTAALCKYEDLELE